MAMHRKFRDKLKTEALVFAVLGALIGCSQANTAGDATGLDGTGGGADVVAGLKDVAGSADSTAGADAAAVDAGMDAKTLDGDAADAPGPTDVPDAPAGSDAPSDAPDAKAPADAADAVTTQDAQQAADSIDATDAGGALDATAQTDATEVDAVVPSPVKMGCSDGTREGFGDTLTFATIAACGGAWDQPGVFNMPAKCNREAGNTGKNSGGIGCTVSDLCAEGWHVCYGKDDVVYRNGAGCQGVMTGATPPVFFTTQMSSTGAFECASGANATNDLFGCGNLGCDFTSNATVKLLCAPLGLSSHDMCKGLRNDKGCGDWCNHLGKYPGLPNAWECGSDSTKEALNVTKTKADQQGGVLCCLN